MSYYIVDYGKDTLKIAEVVMQHLHDNNHHTVVYLTDLDNAFMVQEVSEDDFLEHFSIVNEN